MRLLTFRVDGAGRTGVLRPDGSNEVVELDGAGDMLDLIDAGPEGLAHAARTLASARSRSHRLQDVEVLAPLPNPRGNVIAIGRNYQAHAEESARDIQFGWGGQFFKGKSLDGFCPIGPWIVTPDEIEDPQSLRLSLRVNGVVKQDGNTRDMIYTVDAVIEWVSKGMTLLAGAIIATGTPDGVGFARTPPEFLKSGDVMEAEVERIGTLRNRIVSAAG